MNTYNENPKVFFAPFVFISSGFSFEALAASSHHVVLENQKYILTLDMIILLTISGLTLSVVLFVFLVLAISGFYFVVFATSIMFTLLVLLTILTLVTALSMVTVLMIFTVLALFIALRYMDISCKITYTRISCDSFNYLTNSLYQSVSVILNKSNAKPILKGSPRSSIEDWTRESDISLTSEDLPEIERFIPRTQEGLTIIED